jgi:ABC-type Co2+ transport system permease subunit
MSYQQQRSVATIVTGAIVVAVYFWMALARLDGVGPSAESLVRFWAASVLILVPVGIVASIVTAIIAAIVYRVIASEDPPTIEDERDRMIELKANQVSQAIFVLAFVGSMVPIVLGASVTAMFVVLIGGGFIAHVVGEIGRILMYR